jgi:26S proteasome regulatory subunit N9
LDFVTNKNALRDSVEFKNTYLGLYQKVVLAVAPKLNSLALARIASAVVFTSVAAPNGGGVSLLDDSKLLLQELLDKHLAQEIALAQQPNQPSNSSSRAIATTLYLQSQMALLAMNYSNPNSTSSNSKEDLQPIYATIKTNGPLLNQLVPDTPEAMIVNSSHFEMSMTYFKLVGPPEAFYDEAIHYLNYYQPTAEDQKKSHTLAVDLCLAALTGDGVYNLGQVVTNPILQVLLNTSDAWLVELLQACAKGSVPQFKKLCNETYPTQIASQPALVHRATQMQEKMTLLALVEMVFERPASERTLLLADIAKRLEIPLLQVEWVLMRAFSVKLMEGSMDQVGDGDEGGSIVHVTWILPRVLDAAQMSDLSTRFGEWAAKVSATKEYMQEQTPTMTA